MKVTPFLAQEMLFDFATGQLDHDRMRAVKEHLASDEQSRRLLEDIRASIAYCDQLSEAVKAPDDLLVAIHQTEPLQSTLYKITRPKEWPDSIRWSAMAVVLSVASAVLIVSVPWESLEWMKSVREKRSDLVDIARLPRVLLPEDAETQSEVGSEDPETQVADFQESSGDEEFSDSESSNRSKTQVARNESLDAERESLRPSPAQSSRQDLSRGNRTEAEQSAALAASGQIGRQKPDSSVSGAQTASPGPDRQGESSAGSEKVRGFVYRANMSLPNPDDVNSSLVLQMRDLGAERAGEVELGWKRGSGRYYHFSLPEVNEKQLLEILKSYGPVRISKDPHPRVMPQGQVRFILWIEAGN